MLTVTVLSTVQIFPAESVCVYSKIYVHGVYVSTEPLVAVVITPVPSTLSVQVAQLSE